MNNAPSRRLAALDIGRGIAMLLVCISHFLGVYYQDNLDPANLFLTAVLAITKVATPSFVLISGIPLGYFHARDKNFPQLRIHLLDRALFLISVGHVLMAASVATSVGWSRAVSQWYITDTLGLCLIGGLVVIRYYPAVSHRLGLGVFLYSVGWAGWNIWHPNQSILIFLKGIFLGADDSNQAVFWFPLVSWFGMYLVGAALGGWLSTFDKARLSIGGVSQIKISSITLGGAIFIKALLIWLQIPRSLYLPLFSFSKVPPGPMYGLIFGSAALLLLGGLLACADSPIVSNICISRLQRVGRNSFSVFLSQSFLYYTVGHLLAPRLQEATHSLAILLLISSLHCLAKRTV
jgi:uncharacterized membrane protein